MKKIKVGAAFSDSIYSQKSSFVRLKRGYGGDEPKLRNALFVLLLFLAGGALLLRLFFLQVLNGQQYRLLSDSNRTRTEIVHAPRGIIFDRNGVPLVFNIPGYREIVNGKTVFLDQKTALPLLAKGDKNLEIDNLREYPFGEAASHVVGYIGQISQEELSDPAYDTYRVGDVLGKMGIEQYYEKELKGIDGRKLDEVDATGKFVRTLGVTDPIPGQNITITIDNALQQAAYAAMKDIPKGAAIVSKPDGEILAMVSKPSFDPNLFTMGDAYKESSPSAYTSVADVLLDNNGQPLLNRAIGGAYPPGSTFKVVVAATGLEDKKIDASYTVDDTGVLKIGNFSFANWYYTQYGKTDGQVDVVKAIQRSNDIFFYKLGELLGVDAISQEAARFGVGKQLGIDLEGERAGLLPTKEWKLKALGEQWYTGDDYHYGIGQGYLLTTPLQVNAWTQTIANGGVLYKPHLLFSQKPEVLQKNVISPQTQELIRQGMVNACNPGGVAWPLFNFKVKNANLKIDGENILPDPTATESGTLSDYRHVVIACKTGTAQHGDDATLPHAWITLFAPAYNPQVVVTVLAESSGEGSNVSGPVAEKILEAYFGK